MTQIDNKFESTKRVDHMIWWHIRCTNMSLVPTMLKSDRLIFEKCFPAETMTQEGANAIKLRTSTRNWYWSKVSVLAGKRELNLKTVDMPLMLVKCLF